MSFIGAAVYVSNLNRELHWYILLSIMIILRFQTEEINSYQPLFHLMKGVTGKEEATLTLGLILLKPFSRWEWESWFFSINHLTAHCLIDFSHWDTTQILTSLLFSFIVVPPHIMSIDSYKSHLSSWISTLTLLCYHLFQDHIFIISTENILNVSHLQTCTTLKWQLFMRFHITCR